MAATVTVFDVAGARVSSRQATDARAASPITRRRAGSRASAIIAGGPIMATDAAPARPWL
jgi:hypothetical protein